MKNKITLNHIVMLLLVKVDPQLDPDRTEIRPGAAGVRLVERGRKGRAGRRSGSGMRGYWSSAVKRLRCWIGGALSRGCSCILAIYGGAGISQKDVRRRPIKSN